jgi:hypothetical protein
MACSTNGEKRNAYRIMVGTPERRPKRRLVDIKMVQRQRVRIGRFRLD